MTSVVRVIRFGVIGVRFVNEVLAVVEFFDHVGRTLLRDLAALRLEGRVAHLFGHRFACPESSDVQRADPRHLPVPCGIKRVVLGSFEKSVLILILAN